MENQDYVDKIFQQARAAGLCRTQGDFATLLGYGRTAVSSAMNGNENYLTPAFIKRVKEFAESRLPSDNQGAPTYTVPMFPTAARGGSLCDLDEGHLEQECERIVSPVRGATMAMTIYGESMEPEYPSGSVVLLKKIDPAVFVEWGCVYVLDTLNGPICKKISRGSSDDCVLCESINAKYQSFEVGRTAIRGWWRVLMNMSMK